MGWNAKALDAQAYAIIAAGVAVVFAMIAAGFGLLWAFAFGLVVAWPAVDPGEELVRLGELRR